MPTLAQLKTSVISNANSCLTDFCQQLDRKIGKLEAKIITKFAKQSLRLQMLQRREHLLRQIAVAKFKNPVHVIFTNKNDRNYNSFADALRNLPDTMRSHQLDMQMYFSKYVFNVEIGKNPQTNKYTLHVHLLLEKSEYEAFKQFTKFERVGRDPKLHERSAMRAPRKLEQTNQEYCEKIVSYITKYNVMRSSSRKSSLTDTESYDSDVLAHLEQYWRYQLKYGLRSKGLPDIVLNKLITNLLVKSKNVEILIEKSKKLAENRFPKYHLCYRSQLTLPPETNTTFATSRHCLW